MKILIKTIFSFLIVGLVVFGGAGVVKAQSNEVKKELTAIYAEIDKITVEKSVEAIESVLAPDFKAKRDGKEINREEFLRRQNEAAKMIKDITYAESKIEDTKIDDNGEVTVKVSQKVKFVFVKDGKEIETEITSRSLDTWVKSKNGWQLTFTEEADNK